MKEPEAPRLLNVAEAMADGLPVDWPGLREREPSMAEALERLRTIEEVVSAFRTARADPDEETAAAEE